MRVVWAYCLLLTALAGSGHAATPPRTVWFRTERVMFSGYISYNVNAAPSVPTWRPPVPSNFQLKKKTFLVGDITHDCTKNLLLASSRKLTDHKLDATML